MKPQDSPKERGIRGAQTSGDIGHIGTRLTLQADADARRTAAEADGWARFMALANARNLERGVKP